VGRPEGVLELPDGGLVVADTHYHRVAFFDRNGRERAAWGGKGTSTGSFIYPVCLARDPQGRLYVGEYGGNDRVQVFRPDGTVERILGAFGAGVGCFQRPSGLAWRKGLLYVADAFNNRIQVWTQEGICQGVFAPGVALQYPYALSFDAADRLWVVEYGACRVTCLDIQGRLLGRHGMPGAGPEHLRTPWGLTLGADGQVWIADTGNHRLLRCRP
jgi:sugar lactone lactonase YvrE